MRHRYKTGDRVIHRPCFGTGAPESVTITGTGEKNGRPLYDLNNGHWTYESQIVGYATPPAAAAAREQSMSPAARNELIMLRISLARVAQALALDAHIPGNAGLVALPYELLVSCAKDNPRGWNALAADVLQEVNQLVAFLPKEST